MDDTTRCTFFAWADDPMFESLKQSSSTAELPPSPPPSLPSSSQTDTAPPTTPRKRGFHPSSDFSPPELTPSQKRTKLIKEALAESSTAPQTPSRRTRQSEASPSRSQRSQKRLEDIQLGLSSQQSRVQSSVNLTAQGHALKQLQDGVSAGSVSLNQPSDSSHNHSSIKLADTNNKTLDNDEDDDDAALWAKVTPPPLDSPELGSPSDEHDEIVGTLPFASEKGRLLWRSDDPDNIFDDAKSQVTSSTSQSQPYRVPFTEISTDLSADAISTLLENLGGIPDYVRKLERKKIAAERSNEAKAKRIAELEKDVERLQSANKELQVSMGSSMSRKRGI